MMTRMRTTITTRMNQKISDGRCGGVPGRIRRRSARLTGLAVRTACHDMVPNDRLVVDIINSVP